MSKQLLVNRDITSKFAWLNKKMKKMHNQKMHNQKNKRPQYQK